MEKGQQIEQSIIFDGNMMPLPREEHNDYSGVAWRQQLFHGKNHRISFLIIFCFNDGDNIQQWLRWPFLNTVKNLLNNDI